MNLKSRDPKIKMENGKSINLKYREINKISNAVDKLQAANGIRTVFPNNNEDAVSYTHLDVYKRQFLHRI